MQKILFRITNIFEFKTIPIQNLVFALVAYIAAQHKAILVREKFSIFLMPHFSVVTLFDSTINLFVVV